MTGMCLNIYSLVLLGYKHISKVKQIIQSYQSNLCRARYWHGTSAKIEIVILTVAFNLATY